MRPKATLLSIAESRDNGDRDWRFVVNGATRGYYTVSAKNYNEARETLIKALEIPPTHGLSAGNEGKVTLVAIGLVAVTGLAAIKLVKWYRTRTQGVTRE